ncbi:hypothetical protein SSP531S_39840 [Streptomyces spongiicola]|uniref:Uncharacterized protein n=1 Tax=Streptomyces spongiicola TaxID=1690221 RepID=A0A388T5N1_9ACTN|nr:hypothetical protein SSP531S_39840 [Streptomyces spongiicola]
MKRPAGAGRTSGPLRRDARRVDVSTEIAVGLRGPPWAAVCLEPERGALDRPHRFAGHGRGGGRPAVAHRRGSPPAGVPAAQTHPACWDFRIASTRLRAPVLRVIADM